MIISDMYIWRIWHGFCFIWR